MSASASSSKFVDPPNSLHGARLSAILSLAHLGKTAAIMIVRTAITIGVFTLLATALIAAGCNKRPAAQVSRLTDHPQAPRLTDQEIRQKILAASLANYDDPCPCPYSGLNCKGRSAYDRRGEPLCFFSDVTPEMIARFRGNQM